MLELVDTHAHLYVDEFSPDRASVIQKAVESGIARFYLPNIDVESIDAMLDLEGQFPKRCFSMMGLHPCHVGEDFEEQLAIMEDWWTRRSFVAVGEIGIDLYWDQSTYKIQKIAFERQIELAHRLDRPIVIHSRESTKEVIEVLEMTQSRYAVTGIFHCFSGTVEEARKIHELGFYLGIGGVVTFRNAGLDRVVESVPLDWLVLETDSPYLAPAPFRGKRNDSSNIAIIAAKVAGLKGVSIEDVADITTRNANEVFRYSDALTTD